MLSLHNRVITHNPRINIQSENNEIWKLKIRYLKESDTGCYMCQINTNIMKKQIGCIDVFGNYYVTSWDSIGLKLLTVICVCVFFQKNINSNLTVAETAILAISKSTFLNVKKYGKNLN